MQKFNDCCKMRFAVRADFKVGLCNKGEPLRKDRKTVLLCKMLKYKNAPISEVIFGRYFLGNLHSVDSISRLNVVFSADYPNILSFQPLIIEFLKDGKITRKVPESDSIPILYRRFSADKSYLVQLQNNCFYLYFFRIR